MIDDFQSLHFYLQGMNLVLRGLLANGKTFSQLGLRLSTSTWGHVEAIEAAPSAIEVGLFTASRCPNPLAMSTVPNLCGMPNDLLHKSSN